MMFTTIETTLEKGIFTVWLNRPEVHNAFNTTMLEELAECFLDLQSTDAICVILRGRGKSFCAGADLTWMKDVATNSYEINYQESLLLSKCFYSIYTCTKPTIALVHGASLGGANGLLASCDLAYCTDDATFSLSEVKIGIVPACISPYVVKRVGEYGTRELMLTGRRINGKEAEAFHLVNKSVPAEQLEATAQETIKHLRTSGPAAMNHGKKLIYEVTNNLSLKEAYDFTARMIADIRASEEGQEGINAFLEKRKPKWVKE
ncbi:MAG: enoyl-CoA hydratase/isomerase family protein [Bacteroidetes bacterium]|nr:MAG: enoyl-CoA hydratase/isomerase family protein [Bacteroidota bacterium]